MKNNLIKKEKKLEIIKIQMVQKKNTFGQKKILQNKTLQICDPLQGRDEQLVLLGEFFRCRGNGCDHFEQD